MRECVLEFMKKIIFFILGTHLDRLNKCVEQDPDAD